MSKLSYVSAVEHYDKAHSQALRQGGSPAVLKKLLADNNITAPAEYPLGLLQVPIEQIAGTFDEGRSNAFSSGFLPLIEKGSEFSSKWIDLCMAHLDEGIHTPIKVYEYMNLYYVLEGNKRVSVLSWFGADNISAEVTRIIPPIRRTEAVKVNYEYIDFFHNTEINYIYFRRSGYFSRLVRLVGKTPYEHWTEDDRQDFRSVFTRFREEFGKLYPSHTYVDASTAFLSFISVFDYASLINMGISEFRAMIAKAEPELRLSLSDQPAELCLDPSEEKAPLLQGLFARTVPQLRIGFIYNRNPEESGWTFSHETARTHLQAVLGERVITQYTQNVSTEEFSQAIGDQIQDGCRLIFSTSSIFLKESLKAALDHPEVHILNCSLNKPQKAVRTYYARMYEVKFLMGAIAASLSENGRLGFVADYPIYGTLAGINAFALGAQMIRPDIRIYLNWSKLDGVDLDKFLWENELSIICGKDTDIGINDRRYGLYRIRNGEIWNIATPVWNWSVFYEKIARSVLNGSWKADEPKDITKGISYWWGMSTGIVNLIYSRKLPAGTLRLVRALRDGILTGSLLPFRGPLYSQEGVVRTGSYETLQPGEIIAMNWLAENVIGSIPDASSLTDEAQIMADFQSVRTEENIL